MKPKLMKHLQTIQIGLLIRRLLVGGVLLVIIFFSKSCGLFAWDIVKENNYQIQVYNSTSTRVDFLLIPHNYDYSTSIGPGSTVKIESWFDFNNDEDPFFDGLFSTQDNRFWNEISIRWNDTLLRTWYGPAIDTIENYHSFFNKKSWYFTPKMEDLPSDSLFATFTIIEADFVLNN